MKLQVKWTVVPTALTMVLAIATAGYTNPIQTPLQSPVVVNGNSGGSQSSSCGFIGNNPNQVVVVNQRTPLRFSVQGQGQPTLYITGPGGRSQCVMADNYSNGSINIPGMWDAGTYSVFVGSRNQGSNPFTLSITQEN